MTDAATAEANDFKEERLDIMISRLDQFDVVAFQETWLVLDNGRKARLVAAAKQAGYPYFVRSECRGRLNDGMLLILSRHPITDSKELTFSQGKGFDGMATKGVLWARIRLCDDPGCVLDLFTTHLQSGGGHDPTAAATGARGGDPEKYWARMSQLSELGAFVKRQMAISAGRTGGAQPVGLVTGDFNVNGRTAYDDGTPTTGTGPYGVMLAKMDLPSADGQWQLDDLLLRNSSSNSSSSSSSSGSKSRSELPVTSTKRGFPAGSSKILGFDAEYGETLDYLFWVSRQNRGAISAAAAAAAATAATPGTAPAAAPAVTSATTRSMQITVEPGSSRVDPMRVAGHPFVALSDHFAVLTTLLCQPQPQRRRQQR